MLNKNMIKNSARLTGFRGFTLVELMITVAIIGILAALSYPSYRHFVVRSDRAEAARELVRLANLQEQLFVDSRGYTTDINDLGVGAAAVYETDSKKYKITATTSANNTRFTLTADAQGIQYTDDVDCRAITISDTGQRLPTICWEQ